MNSEKEKIILLEHSKSHQDILYAQLLFLQESGYKTVLWINEELAIDEMIAGNEVEIIRYKFGNASERSFFTKNLKLYVKENNIRNIVLNTAQGIQARNLVYRFLFSKINFVGILHEAKRLYNSFTQKTLSYKVKKYFVLNDYIAQYSGSLKNKDLNIKSLYPFFIPYQNKSNDFLSNKLLICIPGEVSVIRKNYNSFLETISQNKEKLNKNVRFIFLGSPRNQEGRDVLRRVKDTGLSDLILTYDNYVEEEEYLSKIYESDLVLPLIDKGIKYYKEYSESKISGAFTLAFSFRKPLLMHESMNHIEDFRDLSFFYNDENLIEIINLLADNKSLITEKKKKYDELEKFSFEFQRKNYISFLE